MIYPISKNTFSLPLPQTFSWKFWESVPCDEKTLSPEQVKEMIKGVVAEGAWKKINIAQLARSLDLPISDSEEIKQCALQAKYFLASTRTTNYRRSTLASIIHHLLTALERFLTKLGLIHLFKPAVSPDEVDAKGKDMILLSTIFSTLTTTLIPLMGPLHGGIAIGGIVLSLLMLSLTYPLWRPFPSYLPRVENWTQKKLTLSAVERKELLDQIVEALKFSQPLLIGKLGVGKTEVVKLLVQAIERGDYPSLAGYQVFYMNTTDLMNHTDWVPSAHSPLTYFSQAIEGNGEKLIFVFDQIHMACSSNNSLSEQFNTLLDTHFPHVIGITTIDQFEEFSKNRAEFAQRFSPILVEETSVEETGNILIQARSRLSPETLTAKSMETILIEKTKAAYGDAAVMPRAGLRVLTKCIQKASRDQKIAKLFEMKRELLDVKKQQYAYALDRDEKGFFVVSQLLTALEEQFLSMGGSQIDETLIDQVLCEEQALQKKLG